MKYALIALGFGALAIATAIGVAFAQVQSEQNNTPSHNVPATPYSMSKPVAHVPAKSTVPEAVWKKLDARFAPADQLQKQAEALLRAGKAAEAEQACNKAIAFYQAQGGSVGIFSAQATRQTLGDIYLAEGKYQQALNCYGVASQYTKDGSMNLNAALCYVRMGNYAKARMYYSDQAILKYNRKATASDLPGTRTPKTLEASILLARGTDKSIHGEKDAAFKEFTEALKLVPNNGWAAYHAGIVLWRG